MIRKRDRKAARKDRVRFLREQQQAENEHILSTGMLPVMPQDVWDGIDPHHWQAGHHPIAVDDEGQPL